MEVLVKIKQFLFSKPYIIPAIALAVILVVILTLFFACSGGAEENLPAAEPEAETKAPDEEPAPLTAEESAAHNAKISGADVKLAQFDMLWDGDQMALIATNFGDIEIALFPSHAPEAVRNFIAHAEDGYYNGLAFDRVLKNFIIEGGDPGGGGISKFPFENEYSLGLWHFRGAVSFSKSEDEESGSRFFIVHAPFVDAEMVEAMENANYPQRVIDQYKESGGTPGFDWQRTVFGMVTDKSMSVLDAIARIKTDDRGFPEDTVLIEAIEIFTYAEDAAPDTEENGEDAEVDD